MAGPTAAFEGRHGVWDQVTGPFQLGKLGGASVPFGVERTNLKFFPAEYHSQAPIWIALELRKKVPVGEIEAIDVQTSYMAYSGIGSEPEKWAPQTRETADHSLPYLLAVALTDGAIRVDSFSDERIRDPQLRQLMRRIKVAENKEYTREFPSKLMTRIEVTTRSGQRLVEMASYPKGHSKNPMTDADVDRKFADLCANLLPPKRRDPLLRALWDIDQAPDVAKVIDLVRVEN